MSAPADTSSRFRLHSGSTTPRRGEPVTFGAPFPRGAVLDVADLTVVDADDRPCPTACRVTERWADGSVRWALVDARLDVPGGHADIALRSGLSPTVAHPLTVIEDHGRVIVDASAVRVTLDISSPGLLADVAVAGRSVLDAARTRAVVTDRDGRPCTVHHDALVIEHATPLRVTVRADGTAEVAGTPLRLTWRFTFFADLPVADVELDLHNPRAAQHPGGIWELGDPGSLPLGSVGLDLAPRGDGPVRVDAALVAGDALAARQVPFRICQRSSGGEAWNSRTHVDATGVVPFDVRGFDGVSGVTPLAGLRAMPVVVVSHDDTALAVTADRFWQVFPKGYDVEPDGLLRVWVLPPTGHGHELQGGERCTHRFSLAFAPCAVSGVPLEWRRTPSAMLPAPDTAAAAGVVPGLTSEADPRYQALVGAALDGDDTFAMKRERADEYGWRHFGDFYADHENGDSPGAAIVSHYNNQYDAVLGCLVQACRDGDVRWWRLADDLARHVAHTDIYWTTGDKAAYRGGLFWHTAHYVDAGRSTHRTYPRVAGVTGGGPSNEHCYSSGLLLHYYLTGDPASRDAVASLADWILRMDDGAWAPWPLPWLSRADTGLASSTRERGYHGPGRGAGNAVNTLLDAHRLTGDARYIQKAHVIVARAVHPTDDVTALDLLDVERRWSYTVFLQVLGRYLSAVDELGARDDRWHMARASLLHLARWVAAQERPYLDRPEILEFPTETWAAQDVRKADVLDLAAWHAETRDERAWFLERARFFFGTALDTLTAMPTRTRTRPVVILLSNGHARAWYERHAAAAPLTPPSRGPWVPRRPFVSQRELAELRLEALAGAVGAAVAAGVLTAILG